MKHKESLDKDIQRTLSHLFLSMWATKFIILFVE